MYEKYLNKIEELFNYKFNNKNLLLELYSNDFSYLEFYGYEILKGIINLYKVVDKKHMLNKITSGEKRNLIKYYLSDGYISFLFREVLTKEEFFDKKSNSLIDPFVYQRANMIKCILALMWIDSKEESHFFIFGIRDILKIENQKSIDVYKEMFSFSNPYFILKHLASKNVIKLTEWIYKTDEYVVEIHAEGISFKYDQESTARGFDIDIRMDAAFTLLNDLKEYVNISDYL